MKDFYPRPPRGGRRLQAGTACKVRHFYPRPPRGGRHNDVDKFIASFDFYPRPPRGGRRRGQQARGVTKVFLSTPSARRATTAAQCEEASDCISIHALREEGDPKRR